MTPGDGKVLRSLAVGSLATAALIGLPGLARASRPNIVVIQTDDQDVASVKAKFRDKSGRQRLVMPNTVREIYGTGTAFTNYYASPLCSPSRASLLTGLYPHNSGLEGNSGSNGGWTGYQLSPSYTANMPLALQRSGYRTTHIGKFQNGYFDLANHRVDTTVPPGWDNWFTNSYVIGTKYYGYRVSHNGAATGPVGNGRYRLNGPGIDSKRCSARLIVEPLHGRKCRYLTDVMSRQAVKEIRRKHGSPFYLQVDLQGPHYDVKRPIGPQPATRHLGSADRTPLPHPSGFNEVDISDKPEVIQARTPDRMDKGEIKRLTGAYRTTLESLRSVDDGVGAIIETLRKTHRLKNTYVVFVSDNGEFHGEHRFSSGKFLPYEPATHVPLAIRGPGIPARGRSPEVTANVDLTATALDLAGVSPEYEIDGRSLAPYWQNTALTSRRPVELSLGIGAGPGDATVSARASAINFSGYRIGPYKYIRYAGGQTEIYDLARDPGELDNRIDSPAYAAVRAYLEEHFAAVTGCAGASCRAELPAWPEP